MDYQAELSTEVARRFAAAGLVAPEDRAAGAFAAARRLLETARGLRLPRDAAAEPAHVFSPAGNGK